MKKFTEEELEQVVEFGETIEFMGDAINYTQGNPTYSPHVDNEHCFHFQININDRLYDFYNSVADFKNGKDYMTLYDLLWAYRCIISDAYTIFEGNSVDDFLKQFGYDDCLASVRQGELIYSQCEETQELLEKSEDELCNILNKLSEVGIE